MHGSNGSGTQAESLLQIMLPMTVSLRVLDMLQLPEDKRPKPTDLVPCLECHGVAHGCATCGDHGVMRRQESLAFYMGAHGDALMYGGKKGSAAQAFNALSEGLAMLAFQPGGVKFMEMTFDASVLEARFKGGAQVGAQVKDWVSIIRKTEPEAHIVHLSICTRCCFEAGYSCGPSCHRESFRGVRCWLDDGDYGPTLPDCSWCEEGIQQDCPYDNPEEL